LFYKLNTVVMKSIIILFTFLFFFNNLSLFSQLPNEHSSIIVNLDNLKNDKGLIGINLFIEEDGFPSDDKKSFMSQTFKIKEHENTFVIKNVPLGTYSLSVLHDENSNFEMDTNFFGKPKEGYAVSNNIKPRQFGPPKFKDACFKHKLNDSTLELKLIY